MTSDYIQYEHHGKMVWVEKDVKGFHRSYSLCSKCANYKLFGESNQCLILLDVTMLALKHSIALPVWECPKFEEKKR